MTTVLKPTNNRLPLALALTGLVLLSISPGITQGENHINLLLCIAMCVSPLVLLLPGARVFIPRIDIPFGLVCILLFAGPLLFHPETVRLSTMFFTCAYCVFMMMLARVVRISGLDAEGLMKLIRIIVYAFAVVLVIQQICVLAGWPVFCAGMVYEGLPFKLNSLTAEPSHTAVTLCALMFFYTQTFRIAQPAESLWTLLKERWPVWISLLWTLFSTYNASAFILLPLVFIPFMTRRNFLWVIAGFGLLVAGIYLSPLGQYWQLERIRDIAWATIKLDEQEIINADQSAAFRIVPNITGAKAIWTPDDQAITGHGVDADIHELAPRPTDPDGHGSAGVFGILYNYGLFCALAFWWAIAVMTIEPRRPLTILTFLFALQMTVDYNMQLLWLLLGFGMVFKYTVCNDRKLLQCNRL